MLVIGFLIGPLDEEEVNFATRVFEYSGTVSPVEIALPRKRCRSHEAHEINFDVVLQSAEGIRLILRQDAKQREKFDDCGAA